MEQRRKRAIDEKNNHNRNRQRRDQEAKELQSLERELNGYKKFKPSDGEIFQEYYGYGEDDDEL